jgi:hypothetical protein
VTVSGVSYFGPSMNSHLIKILQENERDRRMKATHSWSEPKEIVAEVGFMKGRPLKDR